VSHSLLALYIVSAVVIVCWALQRDIVALLRAMRRFLRDGWD
jgi:hypothetical protein